MAINEAMARLRALGTRTEVISHAPRELCRSCGGSRAMISRIARLSWAPEAIHSATDVAGETPLRERIDRAEIPLMHMAKLERDVARRRTPALVTDARAHPLTASGAMRACEVSSYVVAPIVLAGRVIGLLHLDRHGQGREVDAEDLRRVAAFAEHFSLLFERTVLAERLERQRERLLAALQEAADAAICRRTTELELARNEYAEAIRRRRPHDPRIPLLTPREREVMMLLVLGTSNASIAQELGVTIETTKSHVARIVRKLHVANRSAAVARYLQLVRSEQLGE